MNIYEEKLLEAISKNEVLDYIRGTKKYMIIPQNIYGEIPKVGEGNFFPHILSEGFKKLYLDRPELNVDKILINSLEDLIKTNNIYDLFCSYSMVYSIFLNSIDKDMNFDKEIFVEFLRDLSNTINEKKEQLETIQTYGGNNSLNQYFELLNTSLEITTGRKIL